MQVTWEAVGVMIAALGLAVAWLESRNNERAHEFQRAVEIAILENNEALIAKINGSYMKTEIANLRFEQAATRALAIEARLIAIEQLVRSTAE